jgi:hypothetical protein
MADLALTAANVLAGDGAIVQTAPAGSAVTAGQPIYLDTAAGAVNPAMAAGTATQALVSGIALNSAATGQPVTYVVAGHVELGVVLTVGAIYCLSANAGKIAPAADLAHPDYVSILGVATTTSDLALAITNSGVQL